MTSAVPVGWKEVDLGDASVVLDNLRVPLSGVQRVNRRGPFPYCGANGVLDHIDDYMIDDDVVLLAEDGGNFDQWRTRPIAYRMKGKIWVNNHAHVLKARKNGDTGFLFYALEHKDITPFISSGTRSKLTRGELIRIKVLMPEATSEQRRISESFRDADDLIATLERLITKKQAIKQGMMQQLLTGRTRLPGFTARWTDIALGDIARFSKGSGLPKSALTTSGSTPCIHYGELFTFYGPEIHTVASRTNPTGRVVISEDLDVLMPTSDVTPRGLAKASAIHERGVVLGGDVLIIRPEPKRAYGPFLAHAIRRDADQVLQLVRGSTVYHLYAADMRNFTLTIPPVEEQRAIAQVLRDSESEIAALRIRLDKARAIKTGMMQQLLTGRTRLPVEAAS